MFRLSVLRICHFIKNPYRLISIVHSKQLTAMCVAIISTSTLVNSTLVHAEFNVAGDEIIIFADDTFKPAPRALGNTDINSTGISNLTDSSLNNDSQADTINIVNDDLWQRIKNGYAMPDSNSALISRHENWYSSRPEYMRRMVERSQRYLFHIVEEVEKRGMPTEIALLPMIESAYNPNAYSRSAASGIWQFIPSTGKNFGLKQNWWVDNRRNVTAATDAALTYLQKLHAMFGAWDLALAAYNAGEGTVGRAIQRNRRLGLPTNYESLNLPPETRNYVPKLQAIKNLMTNPNNYGLEIQSIANAAYFTSVKAPAQIDAHLAAKLAEISYDEFIALNPSYNRPVITKSGDQHELLLPISAAQTYKDNLAAYDKPLVSWQTYHAKRGERMDNIAKKFSIQVAQLRDVNGLSSQKKIGKSSTILVPNGNQTNFKTTELSDSSPSVESTGKVNSELDVASAENNNNEIEPATQGSVTYKVKRGDHMQAIAKRYGVSVKQIMASNSLKSNRVKAGQLLTIETTAAKKSTSTVSSNDSTTTKKKTYIVKRGDTLSTIAQKFDVGVLDIKRWNKKINTHIRPGHKLTIIQSRF
ncbi:MAG TPA: LysM peptidoglycan-binding domain-containing protein [Methylotenera sp.]|nr:LysM peptidoglycan-binding domain-containing protein [Methylotenera sp.]